MAAEIALTPPEIRYFQSLSRKELATARIALKIIYIQLELDSKDARSTLCELHKNFTTWDETEEGKAGWTPLLTSLREYLNQEASPSQELLGRVTALQSCLPPR